MKKLFTKLLLLGVLCLIGSNAWADYEGYALEYYLDFENATTFKNGWNINSDLDPYQGSANGGKVFCLRNNSSSGNRAASISFSTISRFAKSSDYYFEFDWGCLYQNRNESKVSDLTISSKTGILFQVKFDYNAAPIIYDEGGNLLATLVVDNMYASYRTVPSIFYHFVVKGNEDGVHLSVTNGSTVYLDNVVLSNKLLVVDKINANPARSSALMAFDNIKLYARDYVTNPTASVTAVDGASRTITMDLGEDSREGTVVKFYTDTEAKSDLTTYTEPFVVSSAQKIYYYAEATSGLVSETLSLDITAGEVKIKTPKIYRNGANNYVISMEKAVADGITANQTIHYTINGGAELTSTENVILYKTGDVTLSAYVTSDNGFTTSNIQSPAMFPAAVMTYGTKWEYNLNSYPSSTGKTNIADATVESSATELNETTVYNLNGIDCPDLYVDRSSGWLLRNQASSAWKAQSAAGNIVFNNVTTDDIIYVYARRDNSGAGISGINNGSVVYSFGDPDRTTDYYIRPTTDGSVRIKTNSGVAISGVSVLRTIPSQGEDITAKVVENASCEDLEDWGAVTAWSSTSDEFHGNNHTGDTDPSGITKPFAESWVWTGENPAAVLSNQIISHTPISNLKAGCYRVTMRVRAKAEGSHSAEIPTGFSVFANDEVSATEGTYSDGILYGTYSVDVVLDGTEDLIFGIEVEDANFNWISFKNVTLTYLAGTTVPVTIGGAGYATFVTPAAMDFSSSTKMEAYRVSEVNTTAGKIILQKVTEVPAGEAIIVKGETDDIPVIASAAEIENELIPVTAEAGINAPAEGAGKFYVLAQEGGNVVFAPVTPGTTIAKGKGYLSVPAGSINFSIAFDDFEITGIEGNESEAEAVELDETAPIYNLSGVQVDKSYNGIKVQNGIKVK